MIAMLMNELSWRSGILFDQGILSTHWFTVFATFVAINTLGYVAITVVKVLPLPRFRRTDGRNRRAETRGILPEDPATSVDVPEESR